MAEPDVIIIGAGSVGTPLALHLAETGLHPLVIDSAASSGQGENKHAIGGIRATHSDPAKILACRRSIEIFSTWQEHHGDDIEWLQGGYTFPVYREQDEETLKGLFEVQHAHGLEIDWIGPDAISELVPGIAAEGLRGGTHSPGDGTVSPLLAGNAFYRRARALGAEFLFHETVQQIATRNGRVTGVVTDRGTWSAPVVVIAAGPNARAVGATVGLDLPVQPDSHEAGITEPVEPFFRTLVVDLRPVSGSANFYFYQSRHAQVVFCLTPDPPIVGTDIRETSVFLPMVARRLVGLLPRLRNLRVRRVWRGLYPMTPDGSPLVGWANGPEGLVQTVGMCGQGLMLGPGLAETVAHLITGELTDTDRTILEGFAPDRDFAGTEALK